MMTRRNFLSVAAALGAGALLGGCSGEGNGAGSTAGAPASAPVEEDAMADGRTITVTCGEATVTYQLNDSSAASALLAQLSLTLEVDDFSDNEKIFYPPEGLDVAGAPLAESGGDARVLRAVGRRGDVLRALLAQRSALRAGAGGGWCGRDLWALRHDRGRAGGVGGGRRACRRGEGRRTC